MRKSFRISSICILALAVFALCAAPAQATTLSLQRRSATLEALSVLEPMKDTFGLSDIDFEDIEVGDEIPAYDYIDGELVENGYVIPLIANGEVVATAQENTAGRLNVSVSLAEAIAASGFEDVALIYDANGCYVTDGSELYLAGEASEVDESKDVLERDGLTETLASTIDVQDVTSGADVAYVTPAAPAYVSGNLAYNNVHYVSQDPPKPLCGPASIACIVNHIQGATNYDAYDVYDVFYDDGNYDKGLNYLQAYDALNSLFYGVTGYHYYDYVVSEAMCFSSLAQHRPIFGIWNILNQSGRHAVVTFAIHTSQHYGAVMDPEFGPKLVAYDSNYGCYWYQSDYGTHEILYPAEFLLVP